jgi:hypothetical protein
LGAYVPSGSTLTNLPIISGADAETDEAKKTRFAEFLTSLSRGTPAALMYAIKQVVVLDDLGNVIEYVMRSALDETPGSGDVYIYGSGGVPSAALLAAAKSVADGTIVGETYLAGYRPVGIRVRIFAMQETVLNIPMTLTAVGDHGIITTALRNSLSLLLASKESNSTLLVSEITETLLAVTGISKAVVGINENHAIGVSEVLILGTTEVVWT